MRNVDIYIHRLILLFTGQIKYKKRKKIDLEFKLFELLSLDEVSHSFQEKLESWQMRKKNHGISFISFLLKIISAKLIPDLVN